jgi:flagellar hook protein FlgE
MDAMSIGLSGLRTSALGVAVTAQNVANVNTPAYRALQVDAQEQPGGGVRAAGLSRSAEPAVPGGSNVDLASEAVALTTQSGAYRASLAVVKTQDELLGTALDLRA